MVYLADTAPVTLEKGDSLYFDSRRGHLYASAGAGFSNSPISNRLR